MDFAHHRRLVDGIGAAGPRVTVNTATLRSRVTAAPVTNREHEGSAYQVTVLAVGDAGVRLVRESERWADVARQVAVNREFLLEAPDAGRAGQLGAGAGLTDQAARAAGAR